MLSTKSKYYKNPLKHIWLAVFIYLPGFCLGQSNDTILPFADYINTVYQHHPFVYKAAIVSELADAKILKARSAFDPKVSSDYAHKSFDDKNYYSILNAALNIPLWMGSDIKLNFDRNNGLFLNNSDIIPQQGLLGPRIDLVLGRGLFTDDRRITLQQSKIMKEVNDLEAAMIVNDLLYNASVDYLKLQELQLKEALINESLDLARTRLTLINEAYLNGYNAAIDTIETSIALQKRKQKRNQLQQSSWNAELNLNNYLWLNGTTPLEIQNNFQVDTLQLDRLIEIFNELRMNQIELLNQHPLLNIYDAKLESQNLQLKLDTENLKPDLRLSYSPLIDFDNQINNGDFFLDNYKLGASFSYPILNRKARADKKITELYIQDTELDQISYRQKLKIKLEKLSAGLDFLLIQKDQATSIVQYSKNLLDTEYEKFNIGESSVFLLNSRELKYIESQEELINLNAEIAKTCLSYIQCLNKMELLVN